MKTKLSRIWAKQMNKRERGEAASGEVEIEERMFNFNKNNKKETKVIAQQ